MIPQSDPGLLLIDQLVMLASSLKEEDLEDPETFALCSQLVQILDPKPEPMPQDVVDQLSQIQNTADRFRQAVQLFGVMDTPGMQKLLESMKSAGLMKAETLLKMPFVSQHNSDVAQRIGPLVPKGKLIGTYKVGSHTVFHHQEESGESNHFTIHPKNDSGARPIAGLFTNSFYDHGADEGLHGLQYSEHIAVEPRHHGKGMGAALVIAATKHFGTLLSGNTLSPGSDGLFREIGKKHKQIRVEVGTGDDAPHVATWTKQKKNSKSQDVNKSEVLMKMPMIRNNKFPDHQERLKGASNGMQYEGSETFGRHTIHKYSNPILGQHAYTINEGGHESGEHVSAVIVHHNKESFAGAHHSIEFAATKTSHSGRGHSTALHAFATTKHQKVSSAEILTDSGDKVYKKLSQLPHFEVKRHVHGANRPASSPSSVKGTRHVVISNKVAEHFDKVKQNWAGKFFKKSETDADHLVHYSVHANELNTIDPSFHGTGAVGHESRRTNRIPRSYFYEHGTQPEDAVTAQSKRVYKVKRPEKVLDIASEEARPVYHAAFGEADRTKIDRRSMDASRLEFEIKKQGFHGYKNSEGPLPNVVALFHSTPVESSEPVDHEHFAKIRDLARKAK